MIKKVLFVFSILLWIHLGAQNAMIYTIAGDSLLDYSGDNDSAINAGVNPYSIAIGDSGNVFIADYANNRVREVYAASSKITTYAGDGDTNECYSGDGVPATQSAICNPTGITLDKHGNLYIADWGNSRVREVNRISGIITTVAGNGTFGNDGGDGDTATTASLNQPSGVCVDTAGNIYIADQYNSVIRKVTLSTLIISTVAGNYAAGPGYSGDGGPATEAQLYYPTAVTLDPRGNLYIADYDNFRVRRVDAVTGIITTLAGNGTEGFAGDNDSLGRKSEFDYIEDILIDPFGDLIIADEGNGRVRMVSSKDSIVRTIAGGAPEYEDSVPPTATALDPFGLAMDSAYNLYVADGGFNRVRKITQIYTGISEIKKNNTSLSIYPNPSSGIFTVENSVFAGGTPSEGLQTLQLFDTEGRLLREQKIPDKTVINAADLSPGIYTLRLLSESAVSTGKMIIVK